MIRIAIDCDPGWDDAAAVCLASYLSNSIEIKAITTVFGNAPVEDTTINLQSLLHKIDRDSVPVFRGATAPDNLLPSNKFHIANESFLRAGIPRYRKIAYKDLYLSSGKINPDFHQMFDGPTTLICLGPLTNVAKIISHVPHKFDRLIIIGGAFTIKKGDDLAEFNFAQDSRAANEVIRSSIEKILIPLDACSQLSANDLIEYTTSASKNAIISTWHNLLEQYLLRERSVSQNSPLYDRPGRLCRIAAMAWPRFRQGKT